MTLPWKWWIQRERKRRTPAIYLWRKINWSFWPKDEKLFFWNTPGGVPSPSGKKKSWIHIDAEKETFTCWVCLKYPNINNKYNKVTMGCSSWHKNYLSRNDDEKHKVSLISFLVCHSSFKSFILVDVTLKFIMKYRHCERFLNCFIYCEQKFISHIEELFEIEYIWTR